MCPAKGPCRRRSIVDKHLKNVRTKLFPPDSGSLKEALVIPVAGQNCGCLNATALHGSNLPQRLVAELAGTSRPAFTDPFLDSPATIGSDMRHVARCGTG
jgi:hypothetical protein